MTDIELAELKAKITMLENLNADLLIEHDTQIHGNELYKKAYNDGKIETLELVKEQLKKIRPYHIHGNATKGWTPCANLDDIMKIMNFR